SDWKYTNNTIPTDIQFSSSSENMYRLLEREGDHYIYIVNDGSSALYYTSHFASAKIGLIIAGSILAVIFAFFMVIMVLNTVGYFIKYLIIWPITGAGKYSSNGSSSKKRDSYERKKDRSAYQYVAAVQPASSVTRIPPKTTTAAVTKTVTPTPLSAPRAKVPAVNAIGKYVVAGQTKRYDNKSDFINNITRFWDNTSIPERVLGLIALFFFVLGLVTTSWFLIVVMPIIFLGIASIVFFANKNTTEKLIRTVESYQAIYLRDAARILNTSSDLLRMNTWKIIRLGLAPIAYDAENGIIFDVTKVDPSKKEKLSPAAETIHQQLVAEVDKTEEKKEDKIVSSKEIKCPFCDADNPPDSLFCIKCGASLKPAK
ncbi:MAG: zinc ribbon domain-containing protein, partial [Candidatus Heimdallarchaeaceae archaeon]